VNSTSSNGVNVVFAFDTTDSSTRAPHTMSSRSSPDKARAQQHEHEVKMEANGEVEPLSTMHLYVRALWALALALWVGVLYASRG